MYRVNSIANSITTLQVVQDGVHRETKLLPRNFVFTEKITDQIKNLVEQRVLRVYEVPDEPKTAVQETKPVIKDEPVVVTPPTVEPDQVSKEGTQVRPLDKANFKKETDK